MLKHTSRKFSTTILSNEKIYLAQLQETLSPHKDKLYSHPLYSCIHNQRETQIFMENHIFAVWDFMSLLKKLQNLFTCTTFPWIPKDNPKHVHFLNQIVIGEECDDLGSGNSATAISHYQIYLNSMKETGAKSEAVEQFINLIKGGKFWKDALRHAQSNNTNSNIHQFTYEFVYRTLSLCETGAPHQITSSFLFGREDPIPKMFSNILKNLSEKNVVCPNLKLYLERHIEVDGDLHSILGLELLQNICGKDEKKWNEVEQTAIQSINDRIQFWDGILEKIKN